MGNAIAFYVISALILGFALLVVTTKNTVHAVLFLVLNFLAVAALYVLLTAQFLAAIQVLVYAGGIVVLYLFVVMLVNLKRPPEDHSAPQRRVWTGFALAGLVLVQLVAILIWGGVGTPVDPHTMQSSDLAMNNVEAVGRLLYQDYLVPFEVASMLLLVAMVGAIILAKREL
jgi:NADH-quinone oxidoreductase subunit J